MLMQDERFPTWQAKNFTTTGSGGWPPVLKSCGRLVADTNRFNKDTGLPPVVKVDAQNRLPNGRRQLSFSRLGVTVAWEEEPFQWIEPSCFSVVRRYTRGPVAAMRVLAQLEARDGGGTDLSYQVWVQSRNLLGSLAIPIQIGKVSARNFAKVFESYDEAATSDRPTYELPTAPVEFASGGEQRLAELSENLLAEDADPQLVKRLTAAIEELDDMAASRIRAYHLADTWEVARRKVLELCLYATRIGLLEFEWDLLCPLCRGTKARNSSLGGIEPEVHCDTCNIDFDVNFERSVELTFHPNPSIRSIERGEFCVAGPRVTPHVVMQQLLSPGETREVTPHLEQGRYRLRAFEISGGQFVLATAGDAQSHHLCIDGTWSDEELSLTIGSSLILENGTADEQLIVLERLAWTDDATTAAEVTALQRFRDLFAGEALRPGERISVGSLAVLFTDLCGSTKLYNEIGDAPAFGLVMNHFDLLMEAIDAEEGAIVKTIGDAVMAVFRRPVSAIRAIVTANERLAEAAEGLSELRLKAGMHYGPCIAVTLNDRLDYFGSTVNIASRLEHLSEGKDLVMSATVHDDPEVRKFLNAASQSFNVEPTATTLKGFDEAQFDLWRMDFEVSK
jgi:class 3 adenylate cyclase